MPQNHSARVRVEPEHFIPVAKHRLVEALVQRSTNPELFQEFCRLIESIYHFENHDTLRLLKRDFRFFDAEEGRPERLSSSPAEIEAREDRFLSNFIHVMRKANFHPLTQQDVDLTESDDYLFNLPIEIDWDKLDDKMLTRFLTRHSDAFAGEPPEFARRILMFRRGVGIDRSDGFHFLAKIDLLLTKCLEWVLGLFRRMPSNAFAATSSGGAGDVSATGNRNSIHEDRFVERITLRSSNIGISSLFRRTRLQEPTFKELVILFRLAPQGEPDDRDLAINIKAFREIPMADLEVVFPEKKISMQPVDLIKLVVTGTIGLVLFVGKFLFAAVFNPVVALAALATVGGYAGRVFFGFKASKDRYQHLVTQSLYHKNLDNDLGVIFMLLDALEEQELKEAILAYSFLLSDGPCTVEELDVLCERYLHDRFGVEVDFEVDDALNKLLQEEVVEVADGRYRACLPDQALRRLDKKWNNFFTWHTGD